MKRTTWLVLLLLLAVIGSVYLLTLREGHRWGDDFAMYILHARNLDAGHAYSATGYIYNPREPHVGPANYPPGVPFLLAPVYRIWGLNLQAMKSAMVLTFLAALGLLYFIMPLELPSGWRVFAVALIGLNPSFWAMRDDVLSEFPFLFAVCLAVWLVRATCGHGALTDPKPLAAPPILWWLALAVAFALAFAIRNLGAITIPAFALYDLVRSRRIRLFAVVTATMAGALCLFLTTVFQTGGGYGGLFNLTPLWFVSNSIVNVRMFRTFWLNGYSSLFSYLVYGVSLVLFAVGVWRAVRRTAGYFEIFALLYMVVVIPYQIVNYRYLMPIVPIYVGYLLFGVRWLLEKMPAARMAIAGVLVAAVAATYAGAYAKAERGPIREGIGDPEFQAVADFIRHTAAPNDRLIFRKPRLLALLTDRATAIYPTKGSDEQIRQYIQDVGARYIVVGTPPQEDFDPDRAVLARAIARYPDDWKPVYGTEHFRVYEVTRR